MATKETGWWCTASASVIAETNTTKTIRVTCYWTTGTWTYDIARVSAWVYCNGTHQNVMDNGNVYAMSYNQSYSLGYYDFVVNKGTSGQNAVVGAKITASSSYVSGTKWSGDINVWVDAKPSYTITYNANGGTGAPGNQTKWYGTNLTLSSTKPSRTGYTFSKWNTNSGGTGTSYNSGATYSGNANLTLYAIWKANTYTVTYNANGGTGAPAAQTKTYGTTLKLSTTKPTRTNYNFKGWSTSASGSVVYAAGANYTNNSAVTLYAVWELAYVKPRITKFSAQRCNSSGTVTEDGVYAKVTFNWVTDKTVTAIKIQYRLQTTNTWTELTVTASGTSGSVSQIVNGSFSTESSYFIRAYVSDGSGNDYTTYSNVATIGTIKFPIDVKDKGTGVAVGKVAETDNLFDVGFKSRFRDEVTMDKKLSTPQGTTVIPLYEGGGTTGYMHVCRLTITRNYANQYIHFRVLQRNRNGEIKILFNGVDNTDPTLKNFFRSGDIKAYIVKAGTSIWDMYIEKTESYDSVEIAELHVGHYMRNISIEWINATVQTLPEGCTGAVIDKYPLDNTVSLYYNTSGTSGSVTLSESANNFRYLEIFYYDTKVSGPGAPYNSIKINDPNGKIVSLTNFTSNDPTLLHLRYAAKTVTISGTSITVSDYYSAGWMQAESNSWWHSNEINIVRVLGYR